VVKHCAEGCCCLSLLCSHNLLESVPLSVFHLDRLRTLHIENNRLAVIHNDIGYLDQLEDLVY